MVIAVSIHYSVAENNEQVYAQAPVEPEDLLDIIRSKPNDIKITVTTPPPTPVPTPKVALRPKVSGSRSVSSNGNVRNDYDGLFQKYFGDNWKIIKAICRAESGLNPNAVSKTNDHGLCQINRGLSIYGSQIYDPEFNIKVSKEKKYDRGGWRHWTVYKTGAYRQYLE